MADQYSSCPFPSPSPPLKALGVDTRALMLVQPDCGEQALEVADQLARCGEIGMIVVDSVSALVPKYVCAGGGRGNRRARGGLSVCARIQVYVCWGEIRLDGGRGDRHNPVGSIASSAWTQVCCWPSHLGPSGRHNTHVMCGGPTAPLVASPLWPHLCLFTVM